MYQVKGARGVEIIPNYAIWKDLPFLIKVVMNKVSFLLYFFLNFPYYCHAVSLLFSIIISCQIIKKEKFIKVRNC